MPSASSKSEKLASTEAVDPLKQAIVMIGHKIRNLEKRKSKLDSYKESINSLTKEQVEAISKYDEVVQQLELSKEYVKQFTVISVENDKLRKKQAKKDAQEKYMAEINRVKQVLLIQDVLRNMGTNSTREDFLAGRNGAIQLTEADLKALDDLHIEISPKRISEDGTPFPNDQFQKAAEYLVAIIDGKAREMAGSTGAKLRGLVTSIQVCGYFDKPRAEETKVSSSSSNVEKQPPQGEEFQGKRQIINNVIVPTQNPSEANAPPNSNAAPIQQMVPGGPILPANTQPPMMQPNQQQMMAPNVTNIVPTPVSQVESSFFNAQGFKPPAPPSTVSLPNQSTRQLNDVIQSATVKFNFLQESELDIPEINSAVISGNPPLSGPQMPVVTPSTIPTQTFTNQNFNGQPSGAPAYPPNYPPQPTAFQTFVPAFPAFVAPNATPVQNANANSNSATPIAPLNSSANHPNIPTSNSNINISNNKCNSIPAPIPMAPTRNPNVNNFNQGQQQIPSGYPTHSNHSNPQKLPQPPGQPGFQHGSMTVGSVENAKIEDAVRKEGEMKVKKENEKQDWSQPVESTNWADEWTETTEWNPSNQNQMDGLSNSNKFSSGRPNRNGNGISRNTNGYQGNRSRTNRQGGYRDSQMNQGGNGSSNYYQNQNGYQSRNDKSNDYSLGGKANADLRDSTFKERGDFNNRDRESKDNYGGGFKRGINNRGPGMKGPLDRGDRQGHIPRNNLGGSKSSRNLNRQPGGKSGPSFQRQQPNPVGQTINK